jgi:hypothetical protein
MLPCRLGLLECYYEFDKIDALFMKKLQNVGLSAENLQ